MLAEKALAKRFTAISRWRHDGIAVSDCLYGGRLRQSETCGRRAGLYAKCGEPGRQGARARAGYHAYRARKAGRFAYARRQAVPAVFAPNRDRRGRARGQASGVAGTLFGGYSHCDVYQRESNRVAARDSRLWGPAPGRALYPQAGRLHAQRPVGARWRG